MFMIAPVEDYKIPSDFSRRIPKKRKSVQLYAFLSFILPGLGQLLIFRPFRAIYVLGFTVFGWYVYIDSFFTPNTYNAFMAIFFHILSAIDAAWCTDKYNQSIKD